MDSTDDIHVVAMTVNGIGRRVIVESRRLLVDVLREDLGLTGTNVGCAQGVCGSCTVLVDGESAAQLPAARRPGRRQRHHDRRGPVARHRPAPGAAGVPGRAGPAVRVLHAGLPRHHRRTAATRPGAVGDRDPGGAGRQHVPVHRLRAHRQRRRAGLPQRPGAGGVMSHTTQWVGKDLPRKEDPALVRGHVVYVDDLTFPGMLHAAVLRSPHAHARIVRIDTTAARALPGVHAVLTGTESLDAHRTARPVRGRGGRRARDRRGQGALPRRGRRRGRRGVALRRRGRAGARHRGVRTAARGDRPASRRWPTAPALVHENLESNVVYQHAVLVRRRGRGLRAPPTTWSGVSLFWPRVLGRADGDGGRGVPVRPGDRAGSTSGRTRTCSTSAPG